jgi:hypothetical protein
VAATSAPVFRPAHRVIIRSRQRRDTRHDWKAPHSNGRLLRRREGILWGSLPHSCPQPFPVRGTGRSWATNQSSRPAHGAAPVWLPCPNGVARSPARGTAGVAGSAKRSHVERDPSALRGMLRAVRDAFQVCGGIEPVEAGLASGAGLGFSASNSDCEDARGADGCDVEDRGAGSGVEGGWALYRGRFSLVVAGRRSAGACW